MLEKLSSLLKRQKGFTLIELLIVIAIIAILVVIAIVAINPVERIRDANDERANADVRQAATAIQACITKELAQDSTVDIETVCQSWTVGGGCTLQTGNYVSGDPPANLNLVIDTTAGSAICAYEAGGHDGADADAAPDNAFFVSNQSVIDEVGDTGSTKGSATACP